MAADSIPSVVTYQALEDQASLHFNIAEYYHKVAERFQTYGAPIVEDWRQCNPYHADSYESWKNDFINDMNNQHDWHMQKYKDFLAMVEAWQQHEEALGGQPGRVSHGRQME